MSNERANEFLSWRGRLTPPDALPEQGLEDKELTWQRLAERLEKKPARRGIVWWIAAACLLMALLPASLFFRNRPARPTRLATHPPVPAHTPLSAHIPLSSSAQPPTAPLALPPAPNSGEFATITHPAYIRHPRIASPHPASPPILTAPSITIQSPPPAPTLAIPANPAALAITTTPPPRHALRIVYLNEIDNNPGPSAVTTRPPGFLRLGTGTGGVAATAAASTATNTADWTTTQNLSIINIKVSSPNH